MTSMAEVIKEQAAKNPSAVICIARAAAVALIIMFLTPVSCSVTTGERGRDFVVIWSDDTEVVEGVVRSIKTIVPHWDSPDDGPGYFPPPASTFPPRSNIPPPEAGL